MRNLIFLAALAVATAATSSNDHNQLQKVLEKCNPDICKLPDCLCASSDPPGGLKPSEVPQLVLLTFNDVVTKLTEEYHKNAFSERYNPDGCPVAATYFTTHEYTDYSIVHDLWAQGHEIALSGITSRSCRDYWTNLSVEGFIREFTDQIDLVNAFAQIPKDSMLGVRVPFIYTGDNLYEMIMRTDIKYDNSWSSMAHIDSGLWPFTLDYESSQDCPLANMCPTKPFPGVWTVPMLDWKDLEGTPCSMVDSCRVIPTKENELVDWMLDNFYRHYNRTRSPFSFSMHAAWFLVNPIHFSAYIKVLDHLQGLNDVYLVSIQRALQWIQNPSPIDNHRSLWPSCQSINSNTCNANICQLSKGDEMRWMIQCKESCPLVYPEVGDPLGEGK